MIDDLNLFTTQFVTLWVMLEPLSHLSMFLSVTGHMEKKERRRTAALGLFFAFLILVVFALLGRVLLEAMGISIISFQIAGGIVLFLFSLTMIFTDGHDHGPVAVDQHPAAAVAVYPVAIPILAGPGAILAVVLFSDNNRGTLEAQALSILALGAMMCVLLAVFWMGDLIHRILGEGGNSLLRRVMGLLLGSLSVNLVLNALQIWLKLPPI